MRETKRKIALMHELFGKCESHRCGECSNFVSGKYHDKILRKCSAYGLTHSEASDWVKKWAACGIFNQEYKGRPIIELGRNSAKEPEEPLEGQIEMGDI